VHDLEDLFRAGLIPAERLKLDSREREAFAEWVRDRWRSHGRDVDEQDIADALAKVLTLLGIHAPYNGSTVQRVNLRYFTSALIKRYVERTSIAFDTEGWRLDIRPAARLEVDVLKQLTWRFVIERPALASQQYGQRRVIRQIFNAYMEAADSSCKTTPVSLLPPRTAEAMIWLRQSGGSTSYLRTRLVCDAICSLTEDEAVRLHARLTGQSLGSVMDAIV
jgi:dGTPase